MACLSFTQSGDREELHMTVTELAAYTKYPGLCSTYGVLCAHLAIIISTSYLTYIHTAIKHPNIDNPAKKRPSRP